MGGEKNSRCAGSYVPRQSIDWFWSEAGVFYIFQGKDRLGDRDMEQGPPVENVKHGYILSI